MRMTALEKRFVNSLGHTRAVDARAWELLSRIGYRSGWRYLDVGCGVGTAARRIAAASELSVTAVDVDPKQIETARGGAPLPNLQYRVMNATQLEFADAQFDVVATYMATHHIPHWERALDEMLRVLRTGGYLVYRDFVFPSWLAKILRHIIPLTGFPSTGALQAIAARAGLVKFYESHESGKVNVIWIKKGQGPQA